MHCQKVKISLDRGLVAHPSERIVSMLSDPVISGHNGHDLFRIANDFFAIAFCNAKYSVVHYSMPQRERTMEPQQEKRWDLKKLPQT